MSKQRSKKSTKRAPTKPRIVKEVSVEPLIDGSQIPEPESRSKSGSATDPLPSVAPEINLDQQHVQQAIELGKSLIRDGKSKADAARAVFDLLKSESKELVVAAFVAGATLTEKGAMTYWYNCRRKAAKNN